MIFSCENIKTLSKHMNSISKVYDSVSFYMVIVKNAATLGEIELGEHESFFYSDKFRLLSNCAF